MIRSLRGVVVRVRRHDPRLARQLTDAASSVAANVAEGNRRRGRDRVHLFRIAVGSADETRTHLRVAEAWGYVAVSDVEADRVLAMLYRLTQ